MKREEGRREVAGAKARLREPLFRRKRRRVSTRPSERTNDLGIEALPFLLFPFPSAPPSPLASRTLLSTGAFVLCSKTRCLSL